MEVAILYIRFRHGSLTYFIEEQGIMGWHETDNGMSYTVKESSSQADYYVGPVGDSNHCHMWKEKESGDSGVVHRGACHVCEDERSSGSDK